MFLPVQDNENDDSIYDSPEHLDSLFWDHAWQPFTQMKLLSSQRLIERGEGAYLFDQEGRAILDAIGSWWVNIHGHSHPEMKAALNHQLEKIEHLIYTGLSHRPAIELSHKLSHTTDHVLQRVFFSDNGSTAVEIALKMAYQYFWNKGDTHRKEFISLGGGYHGDTFGAMSVGDRGVFHRAFEGLLFPCHALPTPSCPFIYLHEEEEALPYVQTIIDELEKRLDQHGKRICALILEPIIQAASAGFNFYPAILLKRIRKLCDEAGIFLIADEVFTAFGRTGSFYACQQAGIWPDIMALSKGLSGGYLPFAATLTTQKIYEGFYSDDREHTLFHGHSMTANPLGCTVAITSLSILKNGGLEKARKLEYLHKNFQNELKQKVLYKKIKECRFLGSVGIVELGGDSEYTSDFGWRVMEKALEKEVLLRPLGNVIYLTPPYCISEKDLGKAYKVLEEVVSSELGL